MATKFKELVNKILKSGKKKYTKEQAQAIAASIAMEKIGKTKLMKLAQAGRKKAAKRLSKKGKK